MYSERKGKPMKEKSKGKQISFNMISSVISFIVTIGISLFITPLIVEKLGSEAYGFVTLSNNFVSYAALITVALNSMESRFVSISIYLNDYNKANTYFTSVFFANIFIALAMIPVMVFVILKLDVLLQIPSNLVADVKLTFVIVFIQFLVEILTSRFEIATYVTNRLNLYYMNQILASFIRLAVILIGFQIFSVNIVFLVLGSLVGKLFVAGRNMGFTKKFLPNLKVKSGYFELRSIKDVASAGIWNLVNKLSGILLDGLDLLIANIFIGAADMGALSISKTTPAMFMTLRGTLDYSFTPSITEAYAKGDIQGVVRYARSANKVLGIFMIAPMAVFCVFGKSFFELWVPGEDAGMIEILSLLSILSLLAGSCINSVFTIFTITNKLKLNSIVILFTGVATTLTVFALLETTNLGVYAIAGVSSVYALIRNFIFTPIYGAHCLGLKKSTFYHEIITGNVSLVINLLVAFIIYKMFIIDNWITLILDCTIAGLLCLIVNFFIVLSKNERKRIIQMINKKILKGN